MWLRHSIGPLSKVGITLLLIVLSSICISTTNAQETAVPEEEGEHILCFRTLHGSEVECNGTLYDIAGEEAHAKPGSPEFFADLFICIFLILVAGTMSGLTIGLMGLDLTTLDILVKSGTPKEKEQAIKILPLVKRHHLLLVTLLLANAAAMEALPIFLDKMVPEWLAIILSVTAVLFFGEIIPQSICARWGLAVGAHASYLVWVFIFLLFPIAWPISKILDWLLGHKSSTLFRRAQLKEFVNIHSGSRLQNDALVEEEHDGLPAEERLSYDEVLIIKGALDLKTKSVKDIMTPLSSVFVLDVDSCLDQATLKKISEVGHSRIPLCKGSTTNLVGMLLVKNLVGLQGDGTPLSELDMRKLPPVKLDTPLYTMLNIFQTGRSHMAAVVDQANNCLGVVTLEDIIEELIQEEIEDEKDFLKKNKHIEKMLGGRRYSIDGNSSPTKHDTVVNLSATSGARTANGVSKAEDKLQSLDSIGDDDVLL